MNKLIVSLAFILVMGSCQLALNDVQDYFPKVSTLSAIVQADGTVLVEGSIDAEGAAAIGYVGFCCSTKQEPKMLDYQMISNVSEGKFSAIYEGNFQPDSVYYFRSWASNDYGYAYGNTLSVSKIIATAVTPPCTLVANTCNIGGGQGTAQAYTVTKPAELSSGDWEMRASSPNGPMVTLKFGSTVTTGVFTTVNFNSPDSKEVFVSFNAGFIVGSLKAGSKVYVKRIASGVFDISICDAPWAFNNGNSDYYFNLRLKGA